MALNAHYALRFKIHAFSEPTTKILMNVEYLIALVCLSQFSVFQRTQAYCLNNTIKQLTKILTPYD